MSELMDITKAAEALGISVITLRRICYARKISFTRVGLHATRTGRYKFTAKDLEEYLAKNRRPVLARA